MNRLLMWFYSRPKRNYKSVNDSGFEPDYCLEQIRPKNTAKI